MADDNKTLFGSMGVTPVGSISTPTPQVEQAPEPRAAPGGIFDQLGVRPSGSIYPSGGVFSSLGVKPVGRVDNGDARLATHQWVVNQLGSASDAPEVSIWNEAQKHGEPGSFERLGWMAGSGIWSYLKAKSQQEGPTKAALGMAWGGIPLGTIAGETSGFWRGVGDVAGSFLSPVFLALGYGGRIFNSLGEVALESAKAKGAISTADAAEVMKNLPLAQQAIRDGKNVSQTLLDAGANMESWQKGMDALKDAGTGIESFSNGQGFFTAAGRKLLMGMNFSVAKAQKYASTVQALIGAGFSFPMIYGASKESLKLTDALSQGDYNSAEEMLTHIAAGLTLGGIGLYGSRAELGDIYANQLYNRGMKLKPTETWQLFRNLRQDYLAESAKWYRDAEVFERDTGKEFHSLKPVDLQAAMYLTQSGMDRDVLIHRYNLLLDAAGRGEEKLPETVRKMDGTPLEGDSPVTDESQLVKERRYAQLAMEQRLAKSNNYGGNGKELSEMLDAYRRAIDPSDDLRQLSQKLSEEFSKIGSVAKDNKDIKGQPDPIIATLVHNYVTQIWAKDMDNPIANLIFHDLRYNPELRTNVSMARKRVFENAFEGQLLGRKLAETNPIKLVGQEARAVGNAIATRRFADSLRAMRHPDGSPLAVLSGIGRAANDDSAVFVDPDGLRQHAVPKSEIERLKATHEFERFVNSGKIKQIGRGFVKLSDQKPAESTGIGETVENPESSKSDLFETQWTGPALALRKSFESVVGLPPDEAEGMMALWNAGATTRGFPSLNQWLDSLGIKDGIQAGEWPLKPDTLPQRPEPFTNVRRAVESSPQSSWTPEQLTELLAKQPNVSKDEIESLDLDSLKPTDGKLSKEDVLGVLDKKIASSPILQESGEPKGATIFKGDGSVVIQAFKSADISTMVHELGHVFRRDLTGDDLSTVEKWAGVKDGNWQEEHEEKFARGFERYLRDGKSPSPEMTPLFERFKQWLTQIYRSITGSAIREDIPDNVRKVYDNLLIGDTGSGPSDVVRAQHDALFQRGEQPAWIAPDGTFLPMRGSEMHTLAAKRMGLGGSRIDALDKGAVRFNLVGFGRFDVAMFEANHWNEQTRLNMRDAILNHAPNAESVVIDINEPKHQTLELKRDDAIEMLESGRDFAAPSLALYQRGTPSPENGQAKLTPEPASGNEPRWMWDDTGYAEIPHPAFQDWNTVFKINGKPINVKVNLKVHPDIYDAIARMAGVDESSLAKNQVLGPAIKIGTELKHTILSLSPFHVSQLGLRSLMSGVLPWIHDWNLTDDMVLRRLVSNGLELGGNQGMHDYQMEGVAGRSRIINKAPVARELQSWLVDFTFRRLLPSLKVSVGKKLFGDYLRLFQNDSFANRFLDNHPDFRGLSREDMAARIAAQDTNERFGGLNYKDIGRSAGSQDALRMFTLAPDWLESEVRMLHRMFDPTGGVILRRQMMKFAAGMWLTARILNMLSNKGNPRNDAPFSVVLTDKSGHQKQYSLRTLPTDFMHMATDPWGFMKGRMSPLARTGVTLATGRDFRGRMMTPSQMWIDIGRNTMLPIPVQAALKASMGEVPSDVGNIGQVEKSVGITVTPYKTQAEKMAGELAAERSGTEPLDAGSLRRHQLMMQWEDQLRSGEMKIDDLQKSVEDGAVSYKEAKDMVRNVRETDGMEPERARLYLRAQRLPMKEFLQVWDAATSDEKVSLFDLMRKKVKTYMLNSLKNMTPEERDRDSTYQRIREIFPTQTAF